MDKRLSRPSEDGHGIKDDLVSIEWYRGYVSRLKQPTYLGGISWGVSCVRCLIFDAARDASSGTYHTPALLGEGDAGELLNSKTGRHYDWNDACTGFEWGPQRTEEPRSRRLRPG